MSDARVSLHAIEMVVVTRSANDIQSGQAQYAPAGQNTTSDAAFGVDADRSSKPGAARKARVFGTVPALRRRRMERAASEFARLHASSNLRHSAA